MGGLLFSEGLSLRARPRGWDAVICAQTLSDQVPIGLSA